LNVRCSESLKRTIDSCSLRCLCWDLLLTATLFLFFLLPWHIAGNPLKLSRLFYFFLFKERYLKTISQWLFQKISWLSYGWSQQVRPFYIATIVIYAHNEQFSSSFASGHSLYWVVQVRPQNSTCPVQPSWHLMNYLFSSHWSTLESYSSNSQLFCSVFLVLWKMLQLLTFRWLNLHVY